MDNWSPRGKGEKEQKILEELMDEKLPNLMKDKHRFTKHNKT